MFLVLYCHFLQVNCFISCNAIFCGVIDLLLHDFSSLTVSLINSPHVSQVFFTREGKGWGLRTLDDLPKGVFVCEFVGEILTNKEWHQRKIQSTRSGKRPYPILLDADWGTKANLKDEDALCLDATKYGNVARFINHR